MNSPRIVKHVEIFAAFVSVIMIIMLNYPDINFSDFEQVATVVIFYLGWILICLYFIFKKDKHARLFKIIGWVLLVFIVLQN
jgi:hypothetical protein